MSKSCVILLLALLGRSMAAGTVPTSMPRVMLLIDEKSLGTIPTSEVEAAAVALLKQRQVTTVDQDVVRANIKKDQALLKSVGDSRGAAALGTQFGADVIVVGEAVAKPSARRIAGSNLRNYQAVVTLRAVRTDNAENLASASKTASVIDLEDVTGSAKALRKAGEEALQELIPGLLTAWAKQGGEGASGTETVSLAVGGVDQVWKLKALRDRLRSDKRQVHNVVQRSYTAGAALFDVVLSIPAEELAESLVLNPPEGLKVQVLDIKPGRLQLRLVANP